MKLSSLSLSYIRSQMGPNATMTEATVMFSKLMMMGDDAIESMSSSEWVKLSQEAVAEAERLASKRVVSPMFIPKTRWEYKSIPVISIGILNDYGSHGWELCGISQVSGGPSNYIFKRELQ